MHGEQVRRLLEFIASCGGIVLVLVRHILTVRINADPDPINVQRWWVPYKPGLAKHFADDLPRKRDLLRSA